MDSKEFSDAGNQMIDYTIKYLETIRDRRAFPAVKPGFMRDLIPDEAPEKHESWDQVFTDIERVIMPGVSHFQSPHFHAFYPMANSYPSLLADILIDAIGCSGFVWAASPSCTELEVIMLDWLGKLLSLPAEFLACSGGLGGGVIQGTASEATLLTLLTAKARIIRKFKEDQTTASGSDILGKLVCYTSDQAHSSVERAALLGSVHIRMIKSDDDFGMDAGELEISLKNDRTAGLIPFYVVATLGTTPSCAFDDLKKIGAVCRQEDLFLHVDAAYAGSAFICPEFRHYLDGVELADSFNFDAHKWMLVHLDCSALWLKNSLELVDSFRVDPVYLRHEANTVMPDFRHWQIPFGRRFRSIKLWFVMRLYGVEGLRKHIRQHVKLAKEFENQMKSDERFEVPVPVRMGLVCFRLKGPNALTENLIKRINESGRMFVVPAILRGSFLIRFCICGNETNSQDVENDFKVIQSLADDLVFS